jgi:hypothetical protein
MMPKSGTGRLPLFFVLIAILSGCTGSTDDTIELRHYTLDDTNGVLTRTGVEADTAITSDGSGSLRVTADEPATIRLFETGDLDVEDAVLIYEAKLRTEDVSGKVYLEMWCHFPGRGEFFSRAAGSALSGTVDWVSQETPFFLKKGENPDNVRLNMVIDGRGTAWIDDIRVVRSPLR